LGGLEGPVTVSGGKRRPEPSPLGSPILPSRQSVRQRPRINYLKAGFVGIIGVYGILCALSPSTYRWLDLVNLVFHEAGHAVFGFFGDFLGILGGSLMQVLVPSIATGHFLLYGQRWSGMVTLFWVSQSLFNVSVYVKDARAQALPLLGGDGVIRDWSWLLGRLGLLSWDQVIGGAIYTMGLLVLAVSILGGLYFSPSDQAVNT
jgi:hypothetical protein